MCLAVAACAAPADPGPGTLACEVARTPAERLPPGPVDLVLAVSDADTMAVYHDQLVTMLRRWMDVLEQLEGGLPSLRVTVVDGDGAFVASPRLDGCAAPPDPFVSDLGLHWWRCSDQPSTPCRERNYDGTLADAVACIGAVAPAGAPAPALIDRVAGALAADTGVIRPDSALVVVFVSAEDDTSARSPAAFAAELQASRPAPGLAMVSIVAPLDAPRWHALADALADRAAYTSIDADDWLDALALPLGDRRPLDYACLTDGVALDCVAHEGTSPYDSGAAIPPCVMAAPDRPDPGTPLPCYWIEAAPFDDPSCPYGVWVERLAPAPDGPGLVRCACEP